MHTALSPRQLTGHNAENAAAESTKQIRRAILEDTSEGLLLIGRKLVVDDATDLGQLSEMSTHCVLLVCKGTDGQCVFSIT